MSKGKKYEYRVMQAVQGWAAEIIRHATAKEIVVSKRQEGFSSETDAQAWAENELPAFLQKQAERNRRRSER